MIHSFIYTLKRLIRQKYQLFWNLLFPIALGTMFYMAFSGLAQEESFHAIPVAVVLETSAKDSSPAASTSSPSEWDDKSSSFTSVIDSLSESGDDQFLETIYTTEEEALSLLQQKEIVGILYEGLPIRLSISTEMTSYKLEQSILNAFVEQFNMNYSALSDIAMNHPDKLSAAAKALSAGTDTDTDYNTEISYAKGNMDEKLTYFFNLIAMSCLFAYSGGLQVALHNQANLSALAARKGISPVHKLISLLGELCATFVFHFFCIFVSLIYLIFVLGISFGSEGGYIVLAALVGCIAGVSLGFFVGTIGKIGEKTKYGILMAVSMICCFLSGLMVGAMRLLVAQVCPWFNCINPAALISDSFYALTVYQSHDRYFENIAILLAISVTLYLGGFLMVRREKYAAL